MLLLEIMRIQQGTALRFSMKISPISVIVALIWTVFLVPAVSASVFYKSDIIAMTGQAGLTGIESGLSINDSGTVAFVRHLAGGDDLFVGDVSTPPRKLLSVESSKVTFGQV